MEKAYFSDKAEPTAEERLNTIVEIYEDATFRAIGTKMGRDYARRSGEPAYEYLYDHRSTLSLYNLLTIPLWKQIPLVPRLLKIRSQ